jgi:hypothetical protein
LRGQMAQCSLVLLSACAGEEFTWPVPRGPALRGSGASPIRAIAFDHLKPAKRHA